MIWNESTSNLIYQGETLITGLTPLERALLHTFLDNPERPLTKTELIEESWPYEAARAGVSDNSLFQLIRNLRLKLQIGQYAHCTYIKNWRAYPEGGYIFFPSGTPDALPADAPTPTQNNLPTQLTMLREIISKQQQTLSLLHEIVDGVAERVK